MRRRPLTAALDLRRPASLVGGRPIVPLRYKNRLRLFLDMAATARLTLNAGCWLKRASSQWLEAPHHSSLDFTVDFTIEIWRNVDSQGPDRAYIAKFRYDVAGQRSWAVQNSGTIGSEHEITFFLHTGSALVSCTTTNAPKNWSRCQVSVNLAGAGATAANKVFIYFDDNATPAAMTSSGTWPTTLPASQTGALTLGTFGDASSALNGRLFDGALASVRLWNRTLGSDESVILANSAGNYTPLRFSQLGGVQQSGCVAAYDLTETSGTRGDSAGGNHLTEKNGPIGQAQACRNIVDRYPGIPAFSNTFYYSPLWIASSPINAQPALYFGGQHWLKSDAISFAAADLAGDVFAINRPTDVSQLSFDYSLLGVDKEVDATNPQYFFPMYFDTGSGSQLNLRYRDQVTTINGTVRGHTVIAPNTSYVTHQRCIGGTGTGAFAFRVNGVDQTLTYNTTALYDGFANGGRAAWLGTMHGPDTLVLGGLNYNTGTFTEGTTWIQNRFRGYINAILIYGGTTAGASLSAAEALAVENWARARAAA